MTSTAVRQPRQDAARARPTAGGVLTFPRSVGSTLMAITVIGSCIGVVWSMADEQGQFFLFGMLACVVVTIPITRPAYAVLGPWSLLALVIYVSCGIRGLFVGLQLDGRYSIDDLFLLGHGPGYFVRPSVLYVVALGLVAIGYLWRPRRSQGSVVRRLSSFELPALVGAVTVVLALVGLVAFALYAQRTGGFSGGLSTKRTTINGLDLDASYESHGELRFLNTFSSIALWLHVARHAVGTGRATAGTRLFTMGLLANAALLPVYASSRSEVGYIAVVAFAIHYGVAGKLPQRRVVVQWTALCIAVLALMTGARAASQGNKGVSILSQQAIVDSVGEVLVYNRNFGDMQTTAHVIHAVPTLLPLAHGGTITTWLAAPIPRAIWPEKPLLQSGPIIGTKVYGNERSGVPPGFVAEMYWNFSTAGVLIGALLLGMLLAYVRDTFVPYIRGNPCVAVIYAVAVLRLGAYVFAGGVGSGIFKLLSDLACLVAALVLTRLVSSNAGARRTAPRDVRVT